MCKKLIVFILTLCSISSVYAKSLDRVFIKEIAYEASGVNSGMMFLTIVKDDGGIEGDKLEFYLNGTQDAFNFIFMTYGVHTPLHIEYDLKNGFRKIISMNTID